MGYDSIYVADGLACAAGHKRYNFQSKDLDCALDRFFVVEGILYRFSSKERDGGRDGRYVKIEHRDDDRISMWDHPTLARREHMSTQFEVHQICQECNPVWTLKNDAFAITLNDHRPWISWTLLFENGKLLEATPNHDGRGLESTRAAVRAHLVAQGSYVLEDDDPRIEQFKHRYDRYDE